MAIEILTAVWLVDVSSEVSVLVVLTDDGFGIKQSLAMY